MPTRTRGEEPMENKATRWSPIPNNPMFLEQVFELLLRRYLSLRETLTATKSGNGGEDGESSSATGSGFLAAASESAVMAGVVVLAERLGGRLFGSGKQVLSCIRLVLEHEMPRYGSGLRERGFDGSMGADLDSGNSLSGCGQRDDGEDGGFGSADAAARIARMEADEAQEDEGAGGTGLELGLGSRFGSEGEDIRAVPGNSDTGDTLCSVVLGLLTTVLELGEEKRPAEEEQELQAMIPSLQVTLFISEIFCFLEKKNSANAVSRLGERWCWLCISNTPSKGGWFYRRWHG